MAHRLPTPASLGVHGILSCTYQTWSQDYSPHRTLKTNYQLIRVSWNHDTTPELGNLVKSPNCVYLGFQIWLPFTTLPTWFTEFSLLITMATPCLFASFLALSSKPSLVWTTGHHHWLWLLPQFLSFQAIAGIRSWLLPKWLLALVSWLWESALFPLQSFHECSSGIEAKWPTCPRKSPDVCLCVCSKCATRQSLEHSILSDYLSSSSTRLNNLRETHLSFVYEPPEHSTMHATLVGVQ